MCRLKERRDPMGKFEQTRGMTSRETEALDQTIQAVPAQRQAPAAKSAPQPTPQKPQDQPSSDRKKVIIISICAVLLLILIGALIFTVATMNAEEDDPRISGNVYAAGVNLGGMTLEEAKSALHLATDSTFSRKDMVVRLPDDSIVLSPANTGARLDVEAVVEAAFAYRGSGNYTIALLPYLNLDLAYIENTIEAFCESYSSVMTQPTVELKGERPEFDPEDPDRKVEHQLLVITMGTPDYVLKAEDLYNKVLDSYSLNQLSVAYEAPALTEPERPDAQKLYEQYCTEAQDATVNDVTFVVTPEVYGYGFDLEELTQLISQAEYGQVIELELGFLIPHITKDDLTGELFLDVLGSITSINAENNSDDRNTNLQLSCDALDGYVIKADEEFSLNALLGRLTADKGYKKAPAIVGDAEVNTLGGGVSQTASALYYCALLANLEILERHNHTYAVDFVPLGFDANLEYGAKDLRFRNNTGNPIRITASASDGVVVIKLEGTDKLAYKVELKGEIITELAPETIYQTMAKDNVLGYVDGQVLVEPVTGYVVDTIMNRLDKNTGVVLSSKSIDITHYSKRDQQVVYIEPDPTLPTEPEPTVPDVTEPQAPTETLPSDPGVTDPEPTVDGTEAPTDATVETPTEAPTEAPMEIPSEIPTDAPVEIPSEIPSDAPVEIPSEIPTDAPAEIPTEESVEILPTEVHPIA